MRTLHLLPIALLPISVALDFAVDGDVSVYAQVLLLAAILVRIVLEPGLDPIPLSIAASAFTALVLLDGPDLAAYTALVPVYALLPHFQTQWGKLAVYKAKQVLVTLAVAASPVPLAAYYSMLARGETGYPAFAVLLASTTAVYLLILQLLTPDPRIPAVIGNRLALDPHELPSLLRHLSKIVLAGAAALTVHENPLSLPVLLALPALHILLHRNTTADTISVLIPAAAILLTQLLH